jgi:hypothetical protein
MPTGSPAMTITYEFDVRPHLRRGLRYRQLRQRWYVQHRHDGRAIFWRLAVPGVLLFWGLVGYGISLIA